jgi:hypothetical protein
MRTEDKSRRERMPEVLAGQRGKAFLISSQSGQPVTGETRGTIREPATSRRYGNKVPKLVADLSVHRARPQAGRR